MRFHSNFTGAPYDASLFLSIRHYGCRSGFRSTSDRFSSDIRPFEVYEHRKGARIIRAYGRRSFPEGRITIRKLK